MLYRSVRDDQKYTSRVLRFLRINNNTLAHDATNDEAAAAGIIVYRMHRTLGSIDILVYFSAFHFYHQFIIDPSCVGTALLGLHDSSFDFHPTF